MKVDMIVTGWTDDEVEHNEYADSLPPFETDILPSVGDVVAFWTNVGDIDHVWYGRVMLRTFDFPFKGGAISCNLDVRLSDENGNVGDTAEGAI